MRPELANLKAGPKQAWLRIHRTEVERYLYENGEEATREEFNMGADTLVRFIERREKDVKLNRLSEADKYVLRIANAGIAELKRRVNRLERWASEVQPVISVGQALIDATSEKIRHEVKVTPPSSDPLELGNFGEMLKRRS